MAMVFCVECGKKISDRALACPECGAPNRANVMIAGEKKWWVAFILCWMVGVVGGHRYYLRQTTSAVIMTILTCTIFGIFITSIWALVDLIILLCHAGDDAWVNQVAGIRPVVEKVSRTSGAKKKTVSKPVARKKAK